MIKKLDILIIRAFIGPFIATFLVALFVLVMQFFWLYIDDYVGKGLDLGTLGYLIWLITLHWVPIALPLALLLSSIMTFGNLGETFEIVAIKSAGISLARFMRPLLVITFILSGFSFVFTNNIIPITELKLSALQWNIIVSKPAFDIQEGVFYDKIDGYVIKVGKKEKNDSIIHDVVIYEKNYALQDNMMVAKDGIMRVTPDKKFLEFTLKNGWRYQEKGNRLTINTEFIRMGFKEYKKVLDMRNLRFNKRAEDSAFQYNPKMLSLRQLNHSLDSIQKNKDYFFTRNKTDIGNYLLFSKQADSVWPLTKDTLKSSAKIFIKHIPDSLKTLVKERALAQISAAKNMAGSIVTDYNQKNLNIRLHDIEWHRKFTLSAACMVLFLVGAPLGAIIRKGGLGAPLIFAIIFFVIFHLLNTTGEKMAREDVIGAFGGMWLSVLALLPVGLFLVYKAMRDSQLFNKEYYYRLIKTIKLLLQKRNSINTTL